MIQVAREKLVWMANVIHKAIVTDDEGIAKQVLGDVKEEIEKMYGKGPVVAETRLDSGAFLTPRAVLDELAHGCASTHEPEKKRTNLEFCGLKLYRHYYDDGVCYVGTRDFRPCGEKQLFTVSAVRGVTASGNVVKNGKKIVVIDDTTLSMPMLERFMIGGLKAVLARKAYQQNRSHERRKAKRAAKRLEHGCSSTQKEVK